MRDYFHSSLEPELEELCLQADLQFSDISEGGARISAMCGLQKTYLCINHSMFFLLNRLLIEPGLVSNSWNDPKIARWQIPDLIEWVMRFGAFVQREIDLANR